MKLENEIGILEEKLQKFSEQLHILKGRPVEQIEGLFHKEVMVELKEVLAYAEWVEARIAMDKVS